MPGFAALLGARVLEWFVLQPLLGEPKRLTVCDQAGAVGTHQVHERFALPDVAMQPQPAVHRVNHPVAALVELVAPGRKIELPQTRVAPAGVRVLQDGRK